MSWEERFFTGKKATRIAYVVIALWVMTTIYLSILNFING